MVGFLSGFTVGSPLDAMYSVQRVTRAPDKARPPCSLIVRPNRFALQVVKYGY